VIPILVLIALVSSRNVLLQLQERGLWEQAFASAKPSSTLCVVGGILVAGGLVMFDGGTVYVTSKLGQARAAEYSGATEFVQLTKHEEQDFMLAASQAMKNASASSLDLALAKLESLETRVKTLQQTASQDSSLPAILQTYRNGVREWKNGLLALKELNPDRRRAQQMLSLGDKLRGQAITDFQNRFMAKPLHSPN
jgi:hypothetical protein